MGFVGLRITPGEETGAGGGRGGRQKRDDGSLGRQLEQKEGNGFKKLRRAVACRNDLVLITSCE